MLNKLSFSLSFFALCYLLMQFGNWFAVPFGYASLIWPVAGVMMGLYFVYGKLVLLGTFLGTLLFLFGGSAINGVPAITNIALAATAVVQLVLGKALIDKFCVLPVRSHTPLEIVKFLVLTGPVACLLTSLITIAILASNLPYSTGVLVYIAVALWVGNLLSVVFITPVLLFLLPNEYVRKAQRPFAAITATLVVLVTIFSVYLLSESNHKQEQETKFVDATQEFVEATEVLFTSIKHNLVALDGLIQSSEYISKSEFEQFTGEMLSLHTNDAIRAFAWLPKIMRDQRADFEQHLFNEQEPNQQIRQVSSKGIGIAPTQDYYLPIKYSSPYSKNKDAIGLDVSRHPIVQTSVERAIAEETYALTPFLSLVQQQDKFTGVIVYYPSYSSVPGEEPLTGLVEAVLEIDILLSSLHEQPRGDFYTFQLTYGNNTYTHPEFNQKAKFSHQVEFEFFGEPAKLVFVSTKKFELGLINWISFVVLLTGCVLGVVCVMFVFFIVTFNASLTRQVNESTKKLVQQNAELATANEAKNLFLANISHEYRTPLNAIIGFTEIATGEVNDQSALSYFKQINASSNILLGIVNDVLDYSKMQAGELRLESRPFNIRAASQSVVDLLAEKAKQKSIDLKFNFNGCMDSWVNADEVRFKQILINLLNNAIKFTEQGHVTVQCECAGIDKEQRKIVLSVEDTGIGIAEDALDELFKPFLQAEASTNRRFGGTGLGLSIVRQLCDLMGGEVSVESKLNVGSKFTISLPFEKVEKPEQETQLNPTQGFNYKPYKVLVAEDNKVNQLVISKHLEKLEIQYQLADNGQKALELLEQNEVDIILMDLQMPVMDGFTASSLIKQNKNLQHIPIVILSASVGNDEKEKAEVLGIHDYIEKPFKQEQLIEVFNKYLG